MADNRSNPARPSGPTLFRQIAVRLAGFTLLFALLDVGIVVMTYSRQPESLAGELLTLEANRFVESAPDVPTPFQPSHGIMNWSARYVAPRQGSIPAQIAAAEPKDSSAMIVDSTQRERLADGGFRITGVRSVEVGGERRWLLASFNAQGIRPYLPVMANEVMQHVMLPLIPLSLFLLLFNVVAVRRVLQPLRRAEAEADELDPGAGLLRLSEVAEPREVSTLVRAVNRALARVDEAMAMLRGFTANAAHELRTPLSIMQLSLDRLPPGVIRDELQADARHLTRMVGQMLDLAQADAFSMDTAAAVDLAEVGREVVGSLAPKAFAAGRELRLEAAGEATILGHREAVVRIYRNLIENALAHAPGTHPVEVIVGPNAQMSVRDHGPGIDAEDLPHLFDRFWRKDRARLDGAGLGLGIVKRLAEAQGGSISAANVEGGGAIFQVTFPSPSPV